MVWYLECTLTFTCHLQNGSAFASLHLLNTILGLWIMYTLNISIFLHVFWECPVVMDLWTHVNLVFRRTMMQNWCAPHVCGEAYWIAYYYYFISKKNSNMWLYKGRTCFVVTFSLPLSLPFDWTFKIWSMCLLFCCVCFEWMLCCDVVCEKKKKMLITKKDLHCTWHK